MRPLQDYDLDLIIVVNIEGAATPNDLMSMNPYANILEIKPFEPLGGMMSAPSLMKASFEAVLTGYTQGQDIFRFLTSYLETGMHPQVARSQVQAYINDNLDPYPDEGISLESLASNLKAFFLATSSGWQTFFSGFGGEAYWENVDHGYGYQLQKNYLNGVFRIVDEDNRQVSVGSEIVETYEFWQLTRAKHMTAPDLSDMIRSINLDEQTPELEPDLSFLNNIDFDI